MLAVPLSASAHVRITPITAAAGADDTLLTFAVPNESDSAFTTRVQVDLPTATPFGEVDYDPVPGWTAEVTTARLPKPAKIDGATVTEAPVRIVWTAARGTRLKEGQVQLFTVSVGPMPDTGRVVLPATQTYSDGSVEHWNEPTPATGEEPEHPAPTVYIRDAVPEADPQPGGVTVSATGGTPLLPIALSGGALLVGLAALIFAIAALLRVRRSSRP
ncbi:YcnI family protein [uncultured Amnibacterium sp.]|uniref:YcnI family copper-binding membrane protein n=1 Tax=uncultured Amnibacterium sp. TaxID=1631851 RepID=UPI0035CC1633